MSGLVHFLQLRPVLERLDKRLLRQILGVVDVADNAINQQEDPAQVLLYESSVRVRGKGRGHVIGYPSDWLAHGPLLQTDAPRPACRFSKRGDERKSLHGFQSI